ncbi:hypothetical protein FOL47_003899, partial [Perkinsus chesapeaki]
MYRSVPVCNKICARKVNERNREIHKQKLKEMRSTVDTREPNVCNLEHLRINAKREQLLEERLKDTFDPLGHASTLDTPKSTGKIGYCYNSRKARGRGEEMVQGEGTELAGSMSPEGSPMQATEADGGDLRYVLKEGQKLGAGYYLVEMATDGRVLTISAYDGESQKTLELIINEKNHRKLYREVAGDYSKLAARLTIEGDRLVLLPHEPLQVPPELLEPAENTFEPPVEATAPVSDTPSESLTAEELVRPSASSVHPDGDLSSVDPLEVTNEEIAEQVDVSVSLPSTSAAGRAPRVYVRGLTP